MSDSFQLRTLDPEKDEELFKQGYGWLLQKPAWFQYLDGVAGEITGTFSLEKYLNSTKDPNEYNVGLFNGRLQAIYTIQDQKDGSMQVHVNTCEGVDQLALVEGAVHLRKWLFDHGATSVFGWLASVNRPFRRFAERAGFFYCGVRVYRGSLNDKPVAWLRYEASR